MRREGRRKRKAGAKNEKADIIIAVSRQRSTPKVRKETFRAKNIVRNRNALAILQRRTQPPFHSQELAGYVQSQSDSSLFLQERMTICDAHDERSAWQVRTEERPQQDRKGIRLSPVTARCSVGPVNAVEIPPYRRKCIL